MKSQNGSWKKSALGILVIAGGLNLFLPVSSALAGTVYVDAGCTNATWPYTNWTTAAVTIQDGVDAANPGDTVLVNDGVYAAGGRPVNGYALTNRVTVDKPLTVQSVNGPAVSIIQGYQIVPGPTNGDSAVRCAYLTNGASLVGFTLSRGATRTNGDQSHELYGGGVWCESNTKCVLSNCVVAENSAWFGGGGAWRGALKNCVIRANSASGGGGVYGSSVTNSLLEGNSAATYGGGAIGSSYLRNCVISRNSAQEGGGAWSCYLAGCLVISNSANFPSALGGGASECSLFNCTVVANTAGSDGGVHGSGSWGGAYNSIIYYNTAAVNPNCDPYAPITLSCTTPLPSGGSGNFASEPFFVDLATANLRLQSNSPCINAGGNAYSVNSTDLDGRPRIVAGKVDVGVYEFQGSVMSEFIGWLQHYGLPTDGTADYDDPDGDGLNDMQEWIAGTDPTNLLSVLQMLSPRNGVSGVTVAWQSVTNRNYFLERAADLGAQPPFSTLQSNIVGRAGTTSCTDTSAVGLGPFFYRVSVQQ